MLHHPSMAGEKNVRTLFGEGDLALIASSIPEITGAIPAEVIRSDTLDCAGFPGIGQDRSGGNSRIRNLLARIFSPGKLLSTHTPAFSACTGESLRMKKCEIFTSNRHFSVPLRLCVKHAVLTQSHGGTEKEDSPPERGGLL